MAEFILAFYLPERGYNKDRTVTQTLSAYVTMELSPVNLFYQIQFIKKIIFMSIESYLYIQSHSVITSKKRSSSC